MMSARQVDPSRTKDQKDSNKDDEVLGSSMSSWLSGWYDTAKKKLSETNEFMKHDLQEFSQAVQDDASRLVAATATTMKERLNINVDLDEASTATRAVKDSLSNLLGNIANKVGPIRPDDDEHFDDSAIVGTSTGAKVLSPAEARLYSIQTDAATFCNEPDNEEDFYFWLPSYNVEDKKEVISALMLDVSQIRALYTKLVPLAVSHSDFWARYFFKLHQHEKAEEKRAMLVERVHKTYNDIEWDDEDDDWIQAKSIPLNIEMSHKLVEKAEEQFQSEGRGSFKGTTDDKLVEATTKENSKDLTDVGCELTEKSGSVVYKSLSQNVETVQRETENFEGTGELCEPNSSAAIVKATEAANKVFDQIQTDEASLRDKDSKTMDKTPSSESSDDWEKDFDLDMTEDEIQQALKESDAVDADDIGEDWDNWE